MKLTTLTLVLVCGIEAHMEISKPPARTSKFSEYWKKIGQIDYNLNAPLSTKVNQI
jgi:hypothetical protein